MAFSDQQVAEIPRVARRMFEQAGPVISQAIESAAERVRTEAPQLAAQLQQAQAARETDNELLAATMAQQKTQIDELLAECAKFGEQVRASQDEMNKSMDMAKQHIGTMAVQLEQSQQAQIALSLSLRRRGCRAGQHHCRYE